VFRELDRRKARLFIHPTSPPCWEHTSFGRPRPMLEFFFDTTRAVVDLVLNGTIAKHPGIEVIVPHAGATLAIVADRVTVFALLLDVDPAVDVLRDLRRLHFDLAGFPLPRQLDALLTLTTREHLHYGSDYPFTPEFAAATAGERLAEQPGLLDALRANTERLFPTMNSSPTS
jgi:6-methylsalicylate decarboxylase